MWRVLAHDASIVCVEAKLYRQARRPSSRTMDLFLVFISFGPRFMLDIQKEKSEREGQWEESLKS